MAVIPFTLAALKSELQQDPSALGYAALISTSNYPQLKAIINLVRAGIIVPRIDIAPSEVLEAVDIRDFTVPGTVTQPTFAASWWESLTQQSTVRLQKDDGSDTTIIKNIKLLLVASGQGSQARVTALSTRTGSRAEQLFGTGFFVSEQNIADALNS